jgi:hypothetical protein
LGAFSSGGTLLKNMQVITGNMDCTSKHCTKKYTTEVVDKVVSPHFERWKRDRFAPRF